MSKTDILKKFENERTKCSVWVRVMGYKRTYAVGKLQILDTI